MTESKSIMVVCSKKYDRLYQDEGDGGEKDEHLCVSEKKKMEDRGKPLLYMYLALPHNNSPLSTPHL